MEEQIMVTTVVTVLAKESVFMAGTVADVKTASRPSKKRKRKCVSMVGQKMVTIVKNVLGRESACITSKEVAVKNVAALL
mmetsp:Transcript_15160/g.17697  ORF Transcript_15160/g.17697 Transcript_15160/m.17697 type:complete len:80 (-) Transcript_15160:124-363(-)